MNDRTAYRMGEVLTRTKRLRRQRERRLLEGLSALCLLLTVGLAVTFGGVMSGLPSATLESVTFATMILHEGAGGYVLVGVLALVAGAIITMACLWRHKKR